MSSRDSSLFLPICVNYSSSAQHAIKISKIILTLAPNGLRYLRWGGDGEAVQLEK
jgi:hypothetical protein